MDRPHHPEEAENKKAGHKSSNVKLGFKSGLLHHVLMVRLSAFCTFILIKKHHYYHNGLQYSHCILALKLLVVCEPVNQLHDQRFKELPGNLMKNVR